MKNLPSIKAVGAFATRAYAPHWKGISDVIGAGNCVDTSLEDGQIVERVFDGSRVDILLLCLVECLRMDRLLAEARRRGAVVVFWYCDAIEDGFPQIKDKIDLLATTAPVIFGPKAEAQGVSWIFLPQGCLPLSDLPEGGVIHDDALFVGNRYTDRIYGPRTELLRELAIQDAVRFLPSDNDEGERKQIFENLPGILPTHTATLSVSALWDSPLYTSNRLWLTTGNGGVAVVRDFPLVEQFFLPGEEVLTFETPAEFASIMRDLRMDPDLRETVRAAGFVRAQKEHTYANRIRTLATAADGIGHRPALPA